SIGKERKGKTLYFEVEVFLSAFFMKQQRAIIIFFHFKKNAKGRTKQKIQTMTSSTKKNHQCLPVYFLLRNYMRNKFYKSLK
ncbi:hypothetical protein ACQP3F_29970, partial [Escherichia coli]